MEYSILIANIILSMREYQKENNIKNQCVTNAQYLYDIIKTNSNSNVKTKAVFVFSHNNEEDTNIFVSGHLIVILNDETIIEPSYDIFCLKNISYFDNIKDLVNIFDDKVKLKSKIDIKKLICDHIHFMKLSDQINNGELIITEKNHYNKQADYIEKIYSK
jgi:hypothetical protein